MFGADDQNPQRPVPGSGIHPGFIDARPVAQVIANPVPGYDHAKHPEAEAIQRGLSIKRPPQATAPAGGHPFLGMVAPSLFGQLPPQRVGVQGASQATAPNVGMPNAYAPAAESHSPNLPERGKEYPASQRFDIPSHWGQGYIESNGTRIYTYTTPEEEATRRRRDDERRMQAWDNERHRMIRGGFGDMNALMNGPNGTYGHLSPEERVAAMQALGGNLQNLMSTDAHSHAAELQFGNDPHRNPAYVQALIESMRGQGEYHRAMAANADPMKKVELLSRIAQLPPEQRDFALALSGNGEMVGKIQWPAAQASPAEFGVPGVQGQTPAAGSGGIGVPARTPGGPAVNAGNFDQWLGNEHNKAVAAILADPNTSFARKAVLMSQVPGFADPNHPARQAWDTYVHRLFPSRQAFQEHLEGYPVISPDDWRVGGMKLPLTETLFGPMQALKGWALGVPTGTQWGWRERYQDRGDLFDTMDKYDWNY